MLHCVKEFLLHSGKNFLPLLPQCSRWRFFHPFHTAKRVAFAALHERAR
jgi:hypothetical protein